MPQSLRKTVVLVGMMGAGKTAVGTQLARKLGVDFVDQDAEIERAANATVAEIFAEYGEAFFREKEALVLDRLMRGPPSVLSTGGGAYLSDRNRATIRAHGVAVWLQAELNLLWARVRHRKTRPLLQTEDPYGTLAALYAARVPIYAQAEIHVPTYSTFTIDDTANEVIRALARHPGVLDPSPHAARPR